MPFPLTWVVPSRGSLAFLATLSSLATLAACKPRSFNEVKSEPGSDGKAPALLPHSPGHLIFALEAPKADARTPERSVPAKVLYVPDAWKGKLKEGTRLPLQWEAAEAWLAKVARDVSLSDDLRAKVKAGDKRDVLPSALHGWQGVGPLESLAAARAVDADGNDSSDLPIEIRVDASKARLAPDGSLVSFEGSPEVVEGTHVGLVRIVGVVDDPEGKRLDVLHYDPATKSFSRKIIANFRLGPHTPLPTQEKDSPAFVPEDAARSRFNDMGWYAYGEWVKRGPSLDFQVRALEPRALTVVAAQEDGPAPLQRVAPDKAAEYFKTKNWRDPVDVPRLGSETRSMPSRRGVGDAQLADRGREHAAAEGAAQRLRARHGPLRPPVLELRGVAPEGRVG